MNVAARPHLIGTRVARLGSSRGVALQRPAWAVAPDYVTCEGCSGSGRVDRIDGDVLTRGCECTECRGKGRVRS